MTAGRDAKTILTATRGARSVVLGADPMQARNVGEPVGLSRPITHGSARLIS